jgi:type IV secretion system protein VirD4
VWRSEFKAFIKWSKTSTGVEVKVEVTEKDGQWQHDCRKRQRAILDGIASDASELELIEKERQPSDLHGSARWATKADLEKANYIGDGSKRFLLGYDESERYISVPEAETVMHAVVCGPTGCGKTSSIYVPNLIERIGISAIVTEATAGNEPPDLFQKTAGYRQREGQQIYKFNPDDMTSHRINPLQYVKTFDQAAQVASLIVQNTSNRQSYGDQIWENSERQLLTVLVLHAVGENTHLGAIRKWLRAGPDGLAEILSTSQIEEAREEYKGFYKSSSEGFRNGVVSGLMQRLNLWVNPRIVALTETTDIDLNALTKNLFTVYLAVPAQKTHLKPLAALIFNFILNLALDRQFKYPLALFLDEFTNYGYVPGIAEKLTIIRHRKIPAVLGFQDYIQMRKVYGEEDAGLLFSQPGTKIFFRTREVNTAKKISDALGPRTIVDRKVDSNGHVHEREIGRTLMNAGEVMALEQGKAITFTPSSPPILLRTFSWEQYAEVMKFKPPKFRELAVNEELVRNCKETKSKPDWQIEYETKKKEEQEKKAEAERRSSEGSGANQETKIETQIQSNKRHKQPPC